MKEDDQVDSYNVFLCYRGEKSALLANSIYSELMNIKNKRIKIFYAPRCIKHGQDFVETCQSVAGQVSLMILFVTKDFFEFILEEEDVVGKELRSALDNQNCKFLPILFPDFSFDQIDLRQLFTPEEIGRIAHVNPIRFNDVYSFETTALLAPIFEDLAIDKDAISTEKDRAQPRTHITEKSKSDFFSDKNTTEKQRLEQQQNLLFSYDMPVYEKLLLNKSHLNVLDLGSGNGTALMNRLGSRKEIDKIIGIEFDALNVTHANEKYSNSNAVFYQYDVESNDFPKKLKSIMDENGIERFDFINILALVSHLKSPSKLLKVIKKFCSPDAMILIRNIDDGLNIAFPDEDGSFRMALSQLSRCTSSGYRYSGRQLFTYLNRWGYRDITLEKTGINTTRMNSAEKEALFEVVFKFLEEGLAQETAAHPDDIDLNHTYQWLLGIYESLEDSFMAPDFFFHFGFMIYTARV